jgi:hypothetical protein
MAEIAQTPEGRVATPPKARAAPPREAWNADARFYLSMAVVASVIVFLGFAPSFYLKSVIHAPTPPLTFLTVTHGLVFTAWMLLFVTQSALIAAGKPAPHRQLGIAGAILFGVMISLGTSTAITAGRLGHAPPASPPPLAFMALPLMGLSAAAVLVAAALWNRRRPDWHKRLMVSALFVLTGPGTGRIAIPLGLAAQGTLLAFAIADVLLLIAVVYDYLAHKRVHPAYIAAAAVFGVFEVGVSWAYDSPAWMSFAKTLTGAV